MNSALAHNEEELYLQLDRCFSRIDQCQAEIRRLEAELESIDSELDGVSDERQKYEILSGICSNLERLDEIGGNALFWQGLAGDNEIAGHLDRLRDQVAFFERRINKVSGRREATLKEISDKKVEIGYLEEEIDFLKEQEEEAEHEYIVEREERRGPYRAVVMPWTKRGRDEKKFRKILALVLLISVLLGLLIPLYHAAIPERPEVVEIPERLAKLIEKQKPKPIPKQEQPRPEEKKKEEKKEPTKEERKVAREKVKSKGVLAFKNNFADLLEDASLDKLAANTNLSNAGSTARKTDRSIITAQAKSTSGGIRSSSLSHNVAGTGDQIQAVAFSRVDSAIGFFIILNPR